mmetsp:Transcript_4847/g.11317  ORF Transcript_4847/g.11317 Transcript_4847/m.11317 type:complete len:116 (-) Transcript_4847:225-572(-)
MSAMAAAAQSGAPESEVAAEYMKNPAEVPTAVSAVPDVLQRELTPQDEFIIIACDGLWDSVSNEEAVGMVRHTLNQLGRVSTDSLTRVARALANEAGQRTGFHDDITVMIAKICR